MDTTVGAIARAAGLPIATRPAWIRWLSPYELKAVEAATGVSFGAVQAMTLSGITAALRLDPSLIVSTRRFPSGLSKKVAQNWDDEGSRR